MQILPVIMSGGSGTRLWPLSTADKPKQFHALSGTGTMIQQTAQRLRGRHGDIVFLDPVIIANALHADLLADQLAQVSITPSAIVLEPTGRGTAATAAIAALVAPTVAPDALVLLMPADHIIGDRESFIEAIKRASAVARERIVTFGITPSAPETGFGYIQRGEELTNGVHTIEAFKEKPSRQIAEEYLAAGGYTWNSGIFFFEPAVLMREYGHTSSDILTNTGRALDLARREGNTIGLDQAAFAAVRSSSIDIAVMEHTRLAAVVPCDIGWADVGSWAELWRLSQRDDADNSISGTVVVEDVRNCLVRSEGIQVSLCGVSDLIVVAIDDRVLILPRDRAQDVGKLIPLARATPA